MMTRFKNKLRRSGLEDRLARELRISLNTSTWLCRLAEDVASRNGQELLKTRDDVVAESVFWHLEKGGYAAALDTLAKDHYVVAERLQRFRSSRGQQAA